jgi:hypothetical protein
MADKNPMNIIEALVQLRNDLKLWVANNLRVKLDKNLGVEKSGKVLSVDTNGDIVTIDPIDAYTKFETEELIKNAFANIAKAEDTAF